MERKPHVRSQTIGFREARQLTKKYQQTSDTTEEKWVEAYTKLALAFQEKENEICQIAEVGQSLVEQLRKREEEVNFYRTRESDLLHEIHKMEQGPADDQDSKNSGLSFLETEYNSLHDKYEKLEEDYHMLETSSTESQSQFQKREVKLHKEISDLKHHNLSLAEEIESIKLELLQSKEKESTLKSQLTSLSHQKKDTEENKQEYEDKTRDLEVQLQKELVKLQHRDSEIEKNKQQIKELESMIVDFKNNEESMQDTIAALVNRNQLLLQDNEEYRQQVMEFKGRRLTLGMSTDSQPLPATNSSVPTQKFENSLLSELEISLQEKIKAEIQQAKQIDNEVDKTRIPNQAANLSSPFTSDMSDCEFFFLTAAAIKVGLILKFPAKSAMIMQVNVKDLFDQAQKDNIPFHEWHGFLSSTFGNLIFNNNFLEIDKSQQKDLSSKHLEMMSRYPEQNALLHKIFKIHDSEFVVEYFECYLDEQIKGQLFVTLESIYFYAKPTHPITLKFPEIKISLHLVDITTILMKKGFLGIRATAIVITARNSGNIPTFTFSGFKNMDYAYEVLFKHWRNWSADKQAHQPIQESSETTTNSPLQKDKKKSQTWNPNS